MLQASGKAAGLKPSATFRSPRRDLEAGLLLGGVVVGGMRGRIVVFRSGVVVRGVVRGRFGSAWAGEGEFDEQHGDEAEDGKEDKDEHGAADAVPEAVLVLGGNGRWVREEVEVEIQRDADGEQSDGNAEYASDDTDQASGK